MSEISTYNEVPSIQDEGIFPMKQGGFRFRATFLKLAEYIRTRVSFRDLTDTPNDFSDKANKVVAVNSDATGLTFIDPPSGSTVTVVETQVTNQNSFETYSNVSTIKLAGSAFDVTANGTGGVHVALKNDNSFGIYDLGTPDTYTSADGLAFLESDFETTIVPSTLHANKNYGLVKSRGPEILNSDDDSFRSNAIRFVGNGIVISTVNDATQITFPTSDISTILYYRIGVFATSHPEVSEKLAIHSVTDSFVFPPDFGGSRGKVGTPPTLTYTLTVQKNGATIGTIAINSSGVFTFATNSHASVNVVSGDVITVIAPSSINNAIADLSITLRGQQNSGEEGDGTDLVALFNAALT